MKVVSGLAVVSEWISVKDPEAAKALTKQRQEENLRRLKENGRQYQKVLAEMMISEGNEEAIAMLEELERISRSSSKDLRVLRKHLRWESVEALGEAQTKLDVEKEEEALLRRRWWRAKIQGRRAKKEREAVDRASLRKAEATAKVIDAALDEAANLQNVRRQVDLRTEKVLAQKKKRKDGTLKRWRHLLYSVFHWTSEAATELVDTPKATVAVRTDILQHSGQEDSEGPVQEESEGPAKEESEDVAWEQYEDPGEEESEAPIYEESEGPAKEESQGASQRQYEEPVAEESEAPIYEESEGPAEEEFEGAVPHDLVQGRRKRPCMWLVYLELAVSLAVAAIRIYDRLCVRQRRGLY